MSKIITVQHFQNIFLVGRPRSYLLYTHQKKGRGPGRERGGGGRSPPPFLPQGKLLIFEKGDPMKLQNPARLRIAQLQFLPESQEITF